jgi:hypothetical protein
LELGIWNFRLGAAPGYHEAAPLALNAYRLGQTSLPDHFSAV